MKSFVGHTRIRRTSAVVASFPAHRNLLAPSFVALLSDKLLSIREQASACQMAPREINSKRFQYDPGERRLL